MPIKAYPYATYYAVPVSNQKQPISTIHTRSSHINYQTQVESKTATYQISSRPSTNMYNTSSIVSSAPQMATTTYDANYDLGGISNRAGAAFDDLFADGGLPEKPDEPMATPIGDIPLVFMLLLIALYAYQHVNKHSVA